MLTYEEAENFARLIAYKNSQDAKSPKYLPKDDLQAIKFKPDAWVIDAIQRASAINDPKCADNAS